MSLLELVATLLGLVNVGLIIVRSPWNYPFGIAMVAIYAKIFFEVRLYSDAGLQVFFLVVQIVGWWAWLKRRDPDGGVVVEVAGPGERAISVVATVAMAVALGWAMATWTDAALPYWDASIAALSVTGQTLLALRRVENWLYWIVADVLGIGVYAVKDLHLTAALYAVFLVMATAGFLRWRRHLDAVSGLAATS